MASIVDICNGALRKLGVERINSLTEDSTSAKLCNDRYEIIVREVLRSHPWKCAIARTSLASTGNVPLFDWLFEFTVPSDCLRVIKVNTDYTQWAQEGDKILTNENQANIKYIKRVTENLFDSSLVEVISYRLALDLCFSITQSSPREQTLQAQYAVFLADARSFSAQSANQDEYFAKDYIDVRF